jgi:DNA-binding response OmpR family regulator
MWSSLGELAFREIGSEPSLSSVCPNIQKREHHQPAEIGETMELPDTSRSTVPLRVILSVGRDFALLETRDAILRASGYIVESEPSVKQAINRFRAGDYDLVLLCHSIASQDRDHLACSIRASGSRIPITLISRNPGQDAGFADVSIGCEPRTFLYGIRQLLERETHTSGRGRASHDMSVGLTRDEDRLQRRVVLYIDDDTNALTIHRCLLENAGYFVLTTDNGSDGLKIFSTGIADTVILDYAMPLISGGVVAAQMRRVNGEIPLILLSGCSTVPDEDVVLFDHFIFKGCPPGTLLSALDEVLCRQNRGWSRPES